MKNSLVSIILPAYNEEEAMGSIIQGIKEVMNKSRYCYEIIVVDDASDDGTAQIAKDMRVSLIQHMEHKGSGASRKTGILRSKGELIVMLDADGTYPIQDIPKLLDFLPKYDQVIGARKGEKGRYRFLRSSAKWAIRRLASFLAGKKIPDLNSGLRAFKKEIMLKYLYLIPDGFSCVTTMTLAFLCNGYSIKYLPIDYYRRIGKSKFHPIRDSYNYLLTVIRMVMYFNPLKVFFSLGFTLFALGLLKSFYDFFFIVGRLQLSDIIILLSAVLIGMLGLLADLIVIQGKRRP